MVLLSTTPAIVEASNYLRRQEGCSSASYSNTDSCASSVSLGATIAHQEVIAISQSLQDIAKDATITEAASLPPHRLDELLRGSQVYVEPPKAKSEPTSAYRALMASLRREEEERAYQRMINPPPPTETFAQRFPGSRGADLFVTSPADIGEDDEISFADVNRQMALIINILVSIVACSVSIWLVARHWSTPSRLALSMFGSIGVAVAEAVVYAGYIRRLKEARQKGKKEIEIKEILKTWIIGGENREVEKDDTVSIESKKSGEEVPRHRKNARK